MQDDVKLEPCPFCGWSSPIVSSTGKGQAWVSCSRCGAQSGGFEEMDMAEHELNAKAIEEWNRRALRPVTEEAVEAAKRSPADFYAVLTDFADSFDGDIPKASLSRLARRLSAGTVPGVVEGWQPIETAPKDGTAFWGIAKDGEVGIAFWDEQWEEFAFERKARDLTQRGFYEGYPPLMWHPLPAPPVLTGGEQQ